MLKFLLVHLRNGELLLKILIVSRKIISCFYMRKFVRLSKVPNLLKYLHIIYALNDFIFEFYLKIKQSPPLIATINRIGSKSSVNSGLRIFHTNKQTLHSHLVSYRLPFLKLPLRILAVGKTVLLVCLNYQSQSIAQIQCQYSTQYSLFRYLVELTVCSHTFNSKSINTDDTS